MPHLTDLYGAEFERAYLEAEEAGLYEKQVPARQLYSPDDAHAGPDRQRLDDVQGPVQRAVQPDRCVNADGTPRVVHLSNLCTEILEVTDQDETAVCNLGSINLGALRPRARRRQFDFARLGDGRRARRCRSSTG